MSILYEFLKSKLENLPLFISGFTQFLKIKNNYRTWVTQIRVPHRKTLIAISMKKTKFCGSCPESMHLSLATLWLSHLVNIYDLKPLIFIYSIANIFSNSTISSHSSGIFSKHPLPFQTPPLMPNTHFHFKHLLPSQTPSLRAKLMDL